MLLQDESGVGQGVRVTVDVVGATVVVVTNVYWIQSVIVLYDEQVGIIRTVRVLKWVKMTVGVPLIVTVLDIVAVTVVCGSTKHEQAVEAIKD